MLKNNEFEIWHTCTYVFVKSTLNAYSCLQPEQNLQNHCLCLGTCLPVPGTDQPEQTGTKLLDPTLHFTVIEPQNALIDVSSVHKIGRSTDFVATELAGESVLDIVSKIDLFQSDRICRSPVNCAAVMAFPTGKLHNFDTNYVNVPP